MDHIQSEARRQVMQLMHQHHEWQHAGRRVAGSRWLADSLSDASSVVHGRACRESMLMYQFCRTDILMDHIQAGWTDALILWYRHVMDQIQSEARRQVAQLMHQHHKRRHAGRQVAGSRWLADSLSDASSVVCRRASRE